MNVTELRIGNYVCYDPQYPQPRRVLGVSKNWIDTGYRKLLEEEKIFPVPLSKEIFEKAGAAVINDTMILPGNKELKFEDEYKFSFFQFVEVAGNTTSYQMSLKGRYVPTIISSVHQLQNLFYALTGKELNLEL